jgi:hypothetical protein
MQALFIHLVKIIMKISEHQEQVMLITWFRMQYKQYKYHLWAIPNGGSRHIVTAVNLKAEGVLAGVSDLFLMIPNSKYHGMFIEMKAKTGSVSDKQKEFMAAASSMNYLAVVCYGFDEAKTAITNYLQDIKN